MCKLFSVLHAAASPHNAHFISTFPLWSWRVGIVLWCISCVVHTPPSPWLLCSSSDTHRSRQFTSFHRTNCFALKSLASIMFVGVMGLRTHRRWDHSGLSHQGAAICWFYRIWSPVGTSWGREGGVWEVIELPPISWDFTAEVRGGPCVGEMESR